MDKTALTIILSCITFMLGLFLAAKAEERKRRKGK